MMVAKFSIQHFLGSKQPLNIVQNALKGQRSKSAPTSGA